VQKILFLNGFLDFCFWNVCHWHGDNWLSFIAWGHAVKFPIRAIRVSEAQTLEGIQPPQRWKGKKPTNRVNKMLKRVQQKKRIYKQGGNRWWGYWINRPPTFIKRSSSRRQSLKGEFTRRRLLLS
jgi:hypothetical protein